MSQAKHAVQSSSLSTSDSYKMIGIFFWHLYNFFHKATVFIGKNGAAITQ